MPEFHIVIPSASAENLRGCLESITAKEPRFPLDHIIVVDDGARKGLGNSFRGISWVRGVKPFVFSRNVNIGIRAAGTDVVLLNDDARLSTPGGFGFLAEFAHPRSDIGVCSAAVDGYVGNPVQKPAQAGFRTDEKTLAFICVYLPRPVFEVIGPLDERFTAYGGDDVDYCDRIRKAGLLLGIHDGCVVEHEEKLSTFRSKPDAYELYKEGLKIYETKKRTG